MLVEITPVDPATFFAASILVLASRSLRDWIPARCALRIDPIQALRE
jgi:ABC-type antimicrobial peptide transport system permease subunit